MAATKVKRAGKSRACAAGNIRGRPPAVTHAVKSSARSSCIRPKQNAVMGQTHLAGARRAAAADQRRRRQRVMRSAERAHGTRRRARRDEPRDRLNGDDLQRFIFGERGEDGGQASREHRLAAARRADEQQRVTARGSDFGGALS